MAEKPNCMCGHSYAAHTWGTSFCSCYKSSDPGALSSEFNLCGCKNYRPGLCGCGHAWEVHAIIGGNNQELTCPFCGKNCPHWDTAKKTEQNPPNEFQKQTEETKPYSVGSEQWANYLQEKCDCDHARCWHDKHTYSCEAAQCDCEIFATPGKPRQKPPTMTQFSAEKCICSHTRAWHHDYTGKCDIENCNCGLFVAGQSTEYMPKNKWEDELDKEEETGGKVDCVCGHPYNSHYEENDPNILPCAECWTDQVTGGGGRQWDTTCKNYTPKMTEYSDDPTKINAEALRQIGNTGGMTIDEINKKIEEFKAKQVLKQNGVVPKATVGADGKASFANTQGNFWAKCWHKPVHVINGKSWNVYAGTKSECMSAVLSYDIVLNLAGYGSVVPEHKIPFAWGRKYEDVQTKEITLDWPDGGIPVISPMFWLDLKKHLEKSRSDLLVFCIGGHGRTGTAIACILVACGWTAAQAKQWIWRYYCKEAIETQSQENYIDVVEKALRGKKETKKGKVATNGPSNTGSGVSTVSKSTNGG